MLGELARLKRLSPRRDYFGICLQLGVCPAGLIEEEDWLAVSLEGSVREYGASYLREYGFDPPPARLLEAFEVIRTTRNEIEARKFQKMKEQHGRS